MKTLIATALLLAASVANAHDVDLGAAGTFTATELSTLTSLPDEGRTAFIKRVAPEFVAYTERTGHEACGVVAVLANGADGVNPTFSIRMSTLDSQIACKNLEPAAGYVSMGDTIHSHPLKRSVRLTARDAALRGNPAGQLRTEGLNNCRFSDQDYTQKGYLIACGKVMYQTGRGTEKEI
jgi:hypothetical protein